MKKKLVKVHSQMIPMILTLEQVSIRQTLLLTTILGLERSVFLLMLLSCFFITE